MKIATWNVNSLNVRLPHVLDWITANKPDALCLQETKVVNDAFPADMFHRLGYKHIVLNGQPMHHGVATVSRIPLTEDHRHDWQDNGEARHIGVRLPNGWRLENVYVPAGGDIADRTLNPKFGQKLDCVYMLKTLRQP